MPRTRKHIGLSSIQKRRFFSFETFQSKIFFALGLALLVFFSISLAKELIRSYEIKKEIATLQEQISALEKRNEELATLVQYLNTDNYREKEARLRLNLQQPGEKVIAVPEGYLLGEKISLDDVSLQTSSRLSNPQKWWNYFFKRFAHDNSKT